jgi:ribose-phosphate pyrophosphokinase
MKPLSEIEGLALDDIEFITFPGGEIHISSEQTFKASNYRNIVAHIRNSADIMKLLILTDAYKRFTGRSFNLILPYIPYARQDRVANPGESLSIKVFADLINAQNYLNVYVLDPHSEVSMALINNAKELVTIDDTYLFNIVTGYEYQNMIVIAPDAGAYKKLSKVIKQPRLIYATKQRDTKTGKLSNFELHTCGHSLKDEDVLIVDDICDGGGTFLGLAAIIRAHKPRSLSLYISHGIFSKGLDELLKYYDNIYTTNSFTRSCLTDDGHVDIIPVN